MWILYILISIASVLCIGYFFNIFKALKIIIITYGIHRTVQKIPGPPGIPILGNIMDFYWHPEDTMDKLREYCKKYYPIYKVNFFIFSVVNVIHPDDVQQILPSSKFPKGMIYGFLHCWLGTGLLTSFGSKWQHRRKILNPAFHVSILQQFIPTLSQAAKEFVDVISKFEGDEVDIQTYISLFSLKSIMDTALGCDSLDEESQIEYRKSIKTIGTIYVRRFFNPIPYMLDQIYYRSPLGKKEIRLVKTLHNFSSQILKNREADFNSNALNIQNENDVDIRRRLALLDLLLTAKRENSGIDDEGIREEVDTFLFAGHDTTSSNLTFLLMLLANNQDCQAKICEEIEEVFGSNNIQPTHTQLQNLHYMERCIKESLRLYPSVHFISRSCGEDYTTSTGYLIPEHSMIHINIFDVHRIPEFWPDPDKFNPDRFLPENCKGRHPYAYIPFSAGPRNCIGQKFAILEMKVLLCQVLKKFHLEPVDTPDTLKFTLDIVLKTKNGVRVKFLKREEKCK